MQTRLFQSKQGQIPLVAAVSSLGDRGGYSTKKQAGENWEKCLPSTLRSVCGQSGLRLCITRKTNFQRILGIGVLPLVYLDEIWLGQERCGKRVAARC